MELIQWTPNQDLANTFPEFSHIRIYGNYEEPYFVAKDVERLLEIERIHFQRDFDETKDYIKQYAVSADGKNREQIFLTERGLYGLMWRSKTPVADRFKDFVTIVIRELRLRGHVTLTDSIKKLDNLLNEEHSKFVKQQGLSEKYYMQLHDANMKLMTVTTRDKQMENYNRGSPEYKLQLMKEKYFKKLYVYIEPIPHELIDQVQPYDDDDHETDDRILSVSFAKRVKTEFGVIYVPPRLKIDDIDLALKDIALDYKKNRYHSSFEDLANILDNLDM